LRRWPLLYVRRFVKEPDVWKQNREARHPQNTEFRAPLLEIFRLRMLPNRLTTCLSMASGFVTYHTVFGLFATHLQKDLGFWPGAVALPIALANVSTLLSLLLRSGRRQAWPTGLADVGQ